MLSRPFKLIPAFILAASGAMIFSPVTTALRAASEATLAQAQETQSASKTAPPESGGSSVAKVASQPGAEAPATTTLDNSAHASALRLLSSRERQLLDEINFARSNPGEYIKALEAFKANYRGKEIHYPEGRVLVTNEGVNALDDAIKFLREVEPLPPLEPRLGMVQAAKLHANDIASSGSSGHRGSDGSKPDDRISRFGIWDDSIGENIVYDSRTPRYDVIGMIIDDGTSNRGHRENLFSEEFRIIGIAIGMRANGSSLGVVTFARGFRDKR